jgi:chromosome segregation ATPase
MKKETVIEVDGKNYDKTAIQSLLTKLEEISKKAASLKCQIGGYRTSNEQYKTLVEKQKAQISDLNEKLEEKERVICGLQDQISDVNKRITSNEKHIASLSNERDIAVANYEYVCSLPWYQRIFFKGK